MVCCRFKHKSIWYCNRNGLLLSTTESRAGLTGSDVRLIEQKREIVFKLIWAPSALYLSSYWVFNTHTQRERDTHRERERETERESILHYSVSCVHTSIFSTHSSVWCCMICSLHEAVIQLPFQYSIQMEDIGFLMAFQVMYWSENVPCTVLVLMTFLMSRLHDGCVAGWVRHYRFVSAFSNNQTLLYLIYSASLYNKGCLVA